MVDTESTLKLVRKLTDLTTSRRMRWEMVASSPPTGSSLGDTAYAGNDGYATFRLTRRLVPLNQLSALTSIETMFGGAPRTNRIAYLLELLDEEHRGRFPFPDVENMRDLYQAVQHQAANVDQILQHYISES